MGVFSNFSRRILQIDMYSRPVPTTKKPGSKPRIPSFASRQDAAPACGSRLLQMWRTPSALELGRLLELGNVSSIVIDASDEDFCRTKEECIDYIEEALSGLSRASAIQVNAQSAKVPTLANTPPAAYSLLVGACMSAGMHEDQAKPN